MNTLQRLIRAAACGAAIASAAARIAHAQNATASVPIRPLTRLATSPDSFGGILAVRSLPAGRVLVNDGGRHRLVVLDSSLRSVRVTLDSTSGATDSYGPRPTPLIPFLGDSSIFVDAVSRSLVAIAPDGSVGRVMSAPNDPTFFVFVGTAGGVDDRGRLLYRGVAMRQGPVNISMNGGAPPLSSSDSQPILRADLETRRVDTVGVVQNLSARRVVETTDANGAVTITTYVNPLQTGDEWAVLSDGTVAVVRGHDYHVDWLTPDGKWTSTDKLPFDWKRVSDDDKPRLRDSAVVALARQDSINLARRMAMMGGATGSAAEARSGRGGGSGAPPPPQMRSVTAVVPLAEIPITCRPSAPARSGRTSTTTCGSCRQPRRGRCRANWSTTW
jgi:hypothetical protein